MAQIPLARIRDGAASWLRGLGQRQALGAGSRRLLLPMLGVTTLVTLLLMMWLWRDDASYRPVFGASEKVAAADMMAVLDGAQIPYRLHPQSGQVLVPEHLLGQVRMQLASKGVVAQLPAGLELLDKNDPLGVSQFVQDVRFRRGLEGELVQSIMALEPVAAARVHLSLPRATSFVSSAQDKGSASVVVSLKPGQTLGPEQIAAVVKLVAGSVSSLSAEQVTLVDQAGNLLSARVDLSEGGLLSNENEAARRFREEAIRNVHDLLTPVLGKDNFKVSVTAEVDNDRVEETREQFGEAPKVTNEARREENSNERAALGVPGSLSNRPVPTGDASAPAGEVSGNSRNAVTRQYAYDRSIVSVKKARGALKRLSVAVMLNQAAAPGKGGWQSAELAKVDKVLRNGLGISEARGDALVVSNMDFAAMQPLPPWWEERELWLDGVRWLLIAFAALLAYLLLARPLLRLLTQRAAPPVRERELATAAPERLAAASSVAAALPAQAQGGAGEAGVTPRRAGVDAVTPLLENYDLPPAGSSVDVLVDHLKVLSAKEPERVAEVVKQWVQKDGRKQ